MLVMAWHVLSNQACYEELGSDDFDRCDAQAYRLKLIRKLEALGLTVAVEPTTSIPEAPLHFHKRPRLFQLGHSSLPLRWN
jgi:hypothetical protein